MLKMLRDRVLVLPIERVLSTIIEDRNTERFNLGTIVAVGPLATDVEVGQTIRYGEFSYPEYKENGVAYQILQEADIAAVVEA